MKKILLSICVLASMASVVSCDDGYDSSMGFYDPSYSVALVTVKQTEEKDCYLQLDDFTTLYPTNFKGSPFGDKEVRALVNYFYLDGEAGVYNRNIFVNWIDSIRTKSTVVSIGNSESDAEAYGDDPIEIVNDWCTIAEDGYLTLRFRILSNYTGRTHYLNMVTNVDPYDPYTVELRHDATGDVSGKPADGLIAFNLGELPDTNGKTVKLTLKWSGYEADKSVTFDYCTRKSTNANLSGRPIDVQSLTAKVE